MLLDNLLIIKDFCDENSTYNLMIRRRKETKEWVVSIHKNVQFIDNSLADTLESVVEYINNFKQK